MQDHLNSAWNRLADGLEARRSQLAEDAGYIGLCLECQQTVGWMQEKLETVKLMTETKRSGGAEGRSAAPVSEVRPGLGAGSPTVVEVELRAIEARLSELGDRIRQSVEHRRQLASIALASGAGESANSPPQLTSSGHRFRQGTSGLERWTWPQSEPQYGLEQCDIRMIQRSISTKS
ncbi:unnamed protein product [Protopolystoma xenopodis]|uniref:Uncharacterized protein n=1 Tax=Protopolystoma xenopodis TaxID=117903 RepID=A0A448XB26_9PLAT|nr:unnamed protein product [Protopolystoma xenopodis]